MKDTNRRRLMKALAGGGSVLASSAFLPAHWKQPVVDSVLLPAHARTSANIPEGTWEGSLTFEGIADSDTSLQSVGRLVLNALIQPAHACVAGSVPLKIQVLGQQALLFTGTTQLVVVTIQALVVQFLNVHLLGQLTNIRAKYKPDSDSWDVFAEGLNNANNCAGNDANGTLGRT